MFLICRSTGLAATEEPKWVTSLLQQSSAGVGLSNILHNVQAIVLAAYKGNVLAASRFIRPNEGSNSPLCGGQVTRTT